MTKYLGADYPTMSLVIPTIKGLLIHLRDFEKDHPETAGIMKQIRLGVAQWFNLQKEEFILDTLLDPRV